MPRQDTRDLYRDETLTVLSRTAEQKDVKVTPSARRERFADNGDDISYFDVDTRIGDEIRKTEIIEAATITISTKGNSSPFKTSRKPKLIC